MKTSVLISLALISVLMGISFGLEEDGSLILTELDFHDALEKNQYLFVNFHALWCRYSKKLKPEWNKLAKTVAERNYPVRLAKVEAYDEKKLAEEYEIEGYPTIKLFINKVPHPYNGERVESHLLEFLERKLKKDLSEISSVESVESKLKEYEWIGLYSGTNNDHLRAIKDVAFELNDVLFVRTSDTSVKNKYGLSDDTFVLVNNITSKHYKYDGSFSSADLKSFILDHKFPEVPRFSKGTAERIFLSEDPSMILFRKRDERGNSAEAAFKEAYQALKSENIFLAIAYFEDEIGKLLAENLGVRENEFPTVRIVRADKEKIRKWMMEGNDISKASIMKFYQDYKDRKAKRYYLSEKVPEENKDLVLKVVGDTFKKEVLDADKDVLVLFWAPWCGHCRAMMPVYDNVARKTKPVPDFVVAKVDASVNEMDAFGIDIVEYPTILLFTRKDKQNPIEFKGERNEYAFNDFIRAHATVNLAKMKGPNPFDRNEL